jgi:hypothetical protein
MVEQAEQLQFIKADELKGKMRSKEDWYRFLKFTCKFGFITSGGFMVPTFKKISMRFIRDFLQGKKQLMRTNTVNQVNVPRFPELAVVKVFPFVKDNAEVL